MPYSSGKKALLVICSSLLTFLYQNLYIKGQKYAVFIFREIGLIFYSQSRVAAAFKLGILEEKDYKSLHDLKTSEAVPIE